MSASLVMSMARLGLVVLALVGVPGWIAGGRRLGHLLHACVLGLGIHFTALVVATFFTPHVARLPLLLVILTYALAIGIRMAVRRARSGWPTGLPTVGGGGASIVLASVVAAAALRSLHNYHFDDLQHLLYLTELVRLDELFPGKFSLLLTQMRLPAVGPGQLVLARYPYWAVSQVAIAQIAGVPLGDAYFVLGLAMLALTLGAFVALLRVMVSARLASLGVVLLLAASLVVSDNLLNFGGYPFQAGKLLVFVGAAALAAFWRSGAPGALAYAVVALFIAPLLHTNNLVGVGWVLGIALVVALLEPATRTRTIARVTLALVALLVMTVLGSVASGGFLRWVPDARVNASTTALAPTYSVSVPRADDGGEPDATPAVTKVRQDRVSRRIGLFTTRGAPAELLAPAAGIVLCLWLGSTLRRRVETGLSVVAGVVLVTACAASITRQAVIIGFKPGYFALRASLVAIRPVVGASPLTDPITQVMGSAAGWPLRDEPAMQLQDQSRLLLLFHPLVRGALLGTMLSNQTHAVMVLDEGVLGPGPAAKFASVAEVTLLAATGAEAPSSADAEQTAENLMRRLHALDPTAVRETLRVGAGAVQQILRGRSLRVYGVPHTDDEHAMPFATTLAPVTAALAASDAVPAGSFDVRPFLGSALIRAWTPDGCTAGLRLLLVGRATFDGSVAAWLATPTPRATPPTIAVVTPGRETKAVVRFAQPQCRPVPLLIFMHGSAAYDLRFDLVRWEWIPAQLH